MMMANCRTSSQGIVGSRDLAKSVCGWRDSEFVRLWDCGFVRF